VFAPDERHVQQARQLYVVDEPRPAGQQTRILVPPDAGVNVAGFG